MTLTFWPLASCHSKVDIALWNCVFGVVSWSPEVVILQVSWKSVEEYVSELWGIETSHLNACHWLGPAYTTYCTILQAMISSSFTSHESQLTTQKKHVGLDTDIQLVSTEWSKNNLITWLKTRQSSDKCSISVGRSVGYSGIYLWWMHGWMETAIKVSPKQMTIVKTLLQRCLPMCLNWLGGGGCAVEARQLRFMCWCATSLQHIFTSAISRFRRSHS